MVALIIYNSIYHFTFVIDFSSEKYIVFNGHSTLFLMDTGTPSTSREDAARIPRIQFILIKDSRFLTGPTKNLVIISEL